MSGLVEQMVAAASASASVEDGIGVVLQYLHNEMKAGSGMTNPVGVMEEAVAATEDIAKAVQAGVKGAGAGTRPKTDG